MPKDDITIELTKRERDLIAEYGYPFDDIKRQIEGAKDTAGAVEITDGRYWWEQVIGNLSISINEDAESDSLIEELCLLADEIELILKVYDSPEQNERKPPIRLLPDTE
ncbi:MAG TPA: hypothetical protein VMN36_17375 [Verrucomicrobiales bacterium]|nr:hypothetical protein [Verrucomicrobiales bacterium]